MNHKQVLPENEPTSTTTATPSSSNTMVPNTTKQVLNSLILDFLVKHQFQDTAKAFSKESPNLPSIPPLMDCSQGFLLEWWQVFFDLFQVRYGDGNSNNNPNNKLYHDYLRVQETQKHLFSQLPLIHQQQQQQHHFQQQQQQQGQQGQPFLQQQQRGIGVASGMQNQQHQFAPQHQGQPQGPGQTPQPPGSATNANFPINMPPNLNPQQQMFPINQQFAQMPNGQNQPSMEQQQRMAMMMKQQAMAAQRQQIPMNGLDPQQQQQMMNAVGGGPGNLNLQQQLFLQQQQQQQQQPKTTFQQQAQNQMNNLRQQAAMVAQQQQQQQQQQQGQLQGNLTSAMGDSSLKNNSPVGARSNQQLTPQQNAAPAPLPHPSQQGQAQAQHNFQSQQQQQQQQMTKMAGSQGMKKNGQMSNGTSNNSSGRNNNALRDYQNQLMLLERQNKERLEFARNTGNSDSNPLSNGMMFAGQNQYSNSNQNQNQLPNQQQPTPATFHPPPPPTTANGPQGQFNQKPSPATSNNSPALGNKSSPAMGNKKSKKESNSKKGKKANSNASTTANNKTSGQTTPNMSQPPSAGTEPKQPQPTEQMRQLQDKQQRPGSNTPSMGKKDFQPLTPRSEPISGETTKKKRKSGKLNDNNENSNGNSPKKQAKTNANSKNLDPIIKEEENGVLSLKKESSTSLQDQDLDLNPPLAPTQATAMSNTFNDDPFDVHLLDTQHHHQQNSNNSNHNRGQNLSNGSNNLSVSGPGMGMNNLVFGDSTHAFDINFNIDSLDDIWTTTGPGGDITGTGSGSGGAGGTDDDNFMGMNWAADPIENGD